MAGVLRTRAGYSGGTMSGPTYRAMGDHTEAIAIDFDPAVISYREILDQIWQSHDVLRNHGSVQYRHVIWYLDDQQKQAIDQTRDAVAKQLDVSLSKIATHIEPAREFTYAEDYHQKYSLRMQRDFIADLENLFKNQITFTDSTAMTRLNGWFGHGRSSAAQASDFRSSVATWGLPDSIEARLLERF